MGESVGAARIPLYLVTFVFGWAWPYVLLAQTGSGTLPMQTWTLIWIIIGGWALLAAELLSSGLKPRTAKLLIGPTTIITGFLLFNVVSAVNQDLAVSLLSSLLLLVVMLLVLGLLVWAVLRAIAVSINAVLSRPRWVYAAIGVVVLLMYGGLMKHGQGPGGLTRYSTQEIIAARMLGIGRTDIPPEAAIEQESDMQKTFFEVPEVKVVWGQGDASDPFATYATKPYPGTVSLGLSFINQELGLDGRVAVAAILAHELAHQVQFRDGVEQRLASVGYDRLTISRLMELAADAFAGYYVEHSGVRGWANPDELTGYARCVMRVGDDLKGVSPDIYGRLWIEYGDHGTSDMRWKAALWGTKVALRETADGKDERLSWEELHWFFLDAAAKIMNEPIDVNVCLGANAAKQQQLADLLLVNWDQYDPFAGTRGLKKTAYAGTSSDAATAPGTAATGGAASHSPAGMLIMVIILTVLIALVGAKLWEITAESHTEAREVVDRAVPTVDGWPILLRKVVEIVVMVPLAIMAIFREALEKLLGAFVEGDLNDYVPAWFRVAVWVLIGCFGATWIWSWLRNRRRIDS